MPATKNATRVTFFVYGGYSWRVGMGVLGMEGEGSHLVRKGGCRRHHRHFQRVGDVMERRGESKSPRRVKTQEGGLLLGKSLPMTYLCVHRIIIIVQ